MNGYEFTRMETDFTSNQKARQYFTKHGMVGIVLEICHYANRNLRKDEDYLDAKHWFIDSTMSCDIDEAITWMEYYMVNAIGYGIETKNLDWRTKYLAAYDIHNSLCKSRKAVSPALY